MPAYAVAHMRQVTMGPAIVEYLQRIDATLAPFGGRFIVHGGEIEVLEGSWPGHFIAIEFADRGQSAGAWYHSDAYQDIVALRTDNSRKRRDPGRWSQQRAPGHRCTRRKRVSGDPGLRVSSPAALLMRASACFRGSGL